MPAITTPFDKSGDLDLVALRGLIDWLIEQGMHGLVVAGTTGEWYSLSRQEKRDLFKTVSEQAGGKIPIIAGCNAFTAKGAIEIAEAATDCRFDGILLTPPPYVVPSDREIITFYQAVAKECALPICVYNWPPGTNVDMSLEVIRQLSDIDKVVALKVSTTDVGGFCELFFELKEKIRIFFFASTKLGVSLVQHSGLDGTMGAAGVLGRDHPDMFNAIWAGDYKRAEVLAERDMRMMKELFKPDLTSRFGSAPAVFKEALRMQGVSAGYPRPPILPLTSDESEMVRTVLQDLALI